MAGETPAPADASVAIVAAKAPTKRELRKLTAPFLAKEVDFEKIPEQCKKINEMISTHREAAAFIIADQLCFQQLLDANGSDQANLEFPSGSGRDPRSIFERAVRKQGVSYHRDVIKSLVKIIGLGMERESGAVFFDSIFHPKLQHKFPTLNDYLRHWQGELFHDKQLPMWMKDKIQEYRPGDVKPVWTL